MACVRSFYHHQQNTYDESDTAGIHCLGRKVDIICIRRVTNNKWSRLCKKSAVLQSGARIKILPLNKKLIVVLKKEGKHTEDFCYTPSNVGWELLLIHFLGEYLTV